MASQAGRIEFESREDAQAENFRKMLLAMARDVRVMLVKLRPPAQHADHRSLRSDKRRRIAARPGIYAPIATASLNRCTRTAGLEFPNLYPHRFRHFPSDQVGAGNARGVNKILKRCKRPAGAGLIAQSTAAKACLRITANVKSTCRSRRCSTSTAFAVSRTAFLLPGARAACAVQAVPASSRLHRDPEVNGYQSLHTSLIAPTARRGNPDPHPPHASRARPGCGALAVQERRRALSDCRKRPTSAAVAARHPAEFRTRRSSWSTQVDLFPTKSTCSPPRPHHALPRGRRR